MTAIDTSVAVAAVTRWHEAHEVSRRAAADAHIPAHALVESYAVLTRLPPPHRLSPDVASQLLLGWFPASRVLAARGGLQTELVRRLAGEGIAGGATYDGLVALTAAQHGEPLVTRDERAVRTYEALGIEYRLLAG